MNGMLCSRVPHRRDGLTLIEILVVITLMVVLTSFGAGIFTGVLNYYRSRQAAETFLWNLRQSQGEATARGRGGVHGVKFYSGRIQRGAIVATGNSYLPYAFRSEAPVAPPDTLVALDAPIRDQVVNFPDTVRLVQDGTGPLVDFPAGSRIQFTPDGRADGASRTQIDLFDAGSGVFRITVSNSAPFIPGGQAFIGLRFIP